MSYWRSSQSLRTSTFCPRHTGFAFLQSMSISASVELAGTATPRPKSSFRPIVADALRTALAITKVFVAAAGLIGEKEDLSTTLARVAAQSLPSATVKRSAARSAPSDHRTRPIRRKNSAEGTSHDHSRRRTRRRRHYGQVDRDPEGVYIPSFA